MELEQGKEGEESVLFFFLLSILAITHITYVFEISLMHVTKLILRITVSRSLLFSFVQYGLLFPQALKWNVYIG